LRGRAHKRGGTKMSSSLKWEPETEDRRKSFSTAVKFALRIRYGNPVDAVLGVGDVPYLEGLRDADVYGMGEVIEAITKHGNIRVSEQF